MATQIEAIILLLSSSLTLQAPNDVVNEPKINDYSANRRLLAVKTLNLKSNDAQALAVSIFRREQRRLGSFERHKNVRAAIVEKASEEPNLLLQCLDFETKVATEDLSGDYEKSESFRCIVNMICASLLNPATTRNYATLQQFSLSIQNCDILWLRVAVEQTLLKIDDQVSGRHADEMVSLRTAHITPQDLFSLVLSPESSEAIHVQALVNHLGQDLSALTAWALPQITSEEVPFSTRYTAAMTMAYGLGRKYSRICLLTRNEIRAAFSISSFLDRDFEKLSRNMKIVAEHFLRPYEMENNPKSKMLDRLRFSLALTTNLEQQDNMGGDPQYIDKYSKIQEIATAQGPFSQSDCNFLFRALCDEDSILAFRASCELNSIISRGTATAAYDQLFEQFLLAAITRFPDRRWIFRSMNEFLIRMPGTRLEDLFRKLLGEGSPTSKAYSGLLVKSTRHQSLLKHLRPFLLDQNSWVRRCAEEAYEECGFQTWQGQILDATANDEVENWYKIEFANLRHPPDFQEVFVSAARVIDGDNDEEAETAFAKIVDDPSRLPLFEIAADGRSPMNMRGVALRALARNGSNASVAAMLDLARGSKSGEFLNAVRVALEELKRPEAMPSLISAIINGTDKRIDGVCSRAVGRLPGDAPTKTLLNIYLEHVRDDESREIIAQGIAVTESPESTLILFQTAKTWAEERLFRACLTGLISIGTKESISAMIGLLATRELADNQQHIALVQEAILLAVEYYRDNQEIVNLALQQLSGPTSTVRIAAAQAVAGLAGNADALKAVESALSTEKEDAIVEELKRARAKLSGKGAGNKPQLPPDAPAEDF